MKKKYFLILGLSSILVGCSSDVKDYQVKEFLSISNCGYKIATIEFINMNEKVIVEPVLNNTSLEDVSGNVLTVPNIALAEPFDHKNCTINKLIKQKFHKM